MTSFLSFVDQRFAVLKNKFSEAMSICQEHFLLGENDSFWARLIVIWYFVSSALGRGPLWLVQKNDKPNMSALQ